MKKVAGCLTLAGSVAAMTFAPGGVSFSQMAPFGDDQGCIACHTGAPGGDYLFMTDHIR